MKALLLTALFTLTVTTASAQTAASLAGGIGTLAGLIDGFTGTVVRATGGLFMALAMIAFFYGVVEYIWGARQGDGDRVKRGNEFLKWSLVALFVMFSVYGIIRFGQNILFQGQDVNRITVPQLNFGGGSGSSNTGGTTGGGTTGGSVGLPSGAPQGTIGGSCGRTGYCSEGTCDAITNRCVASSGNTGGSGGSSYRCTPGSDCGTNGAGVCDDDGRTCIIRNQGGGSTGCVNINPETGECYEL